MALLDRGLSKTVRVPLPSRRGAALLGALAAAFAALAVLVATGAVTAIDQFSVDHLMPWLVPHNDKGLSPASFYRPFSLDTPTPNKLLDLLTYPCSVLISLLVLALCAYLLSRRAGPVAPVALAVAWLAGNGIEVLGKGLITRPGLHELVHGVRAHVAPFDDSFPSGHMIRGTIVAFAVSLVWPAATRWVALWAALVGPALVLQSAHTITDVIGGALVGMMTITAIYPVVAPVRAGRTPG